jgi:PAS domain S-box-containing protein
VEVSLSPVVLATLEHIDDAAILVAPGDRGDVIYVNAAFERASGHDRRDVVGRSLEALLRPRAVGSEPEIYVMTRATGEEYVVRRKRAPLRADDPESVVLETHRDLTQERATRESEALYRKFAERTTELISRTDSSGRCIYISPSCREVLGYEPVELVGKHALVDLAHPDDRREQQQVLSRFVQQGITSPSPLRRRLRRKDGTYVWLETITNIERDKEGKIVEVHSWARDITSRVLAEQALAQSEARFRSLLDKLPDGVAVHHGGVISYANAEMARMTGHERPEELVGRAVLDYVHPEERDAVRERLRDSQRTGVRGSERRMLNRDGTSRVFEITSLPVMFEGSLGFLAICHDVTKHKRMEERLAIAERMALVGRLASGVGHEINNPLAYMLGSIELARGDLAALTANASANERIVRLEHHLVTIREGAERVRDIVRDLKSLSAGSDDRLGPVDVERTLDVAAATAAHEIRLRARLVKEYGAVPLAWANEGRLAQVFINLLVNAAQAIPEGAANDNEIRIVTREEGGLIVVVVRDTGTGIAPEDLPRVFEPFFTTKPRGIGTGLGLSISHAIVSSLGGTLTAERLSPRGALLRVTLRTSSEALTQAASTASDAKIERQARILLVDDEPNMVRVLAELLSQHDVTVAYTGREAIARLAGDASFDVVVCDLQMNDGTGVDVYEYICERAPDLARRVIFTTGGAFTQGAREFLVRCPQPVLEKPFDPARFTALVSETARRSPAMSDQELLLQGGASQKPSGQPSFG